MAQLFLRLKALALIALLALCASAHATESDKGVLANLISRALSSPSMSVSIGAVDGVLVLRRVDQRHRHLRPQRAVAQGRQGSARLEPAGVVQPAARGRSAHDRAHRVSAPPASVRHSAAGHRRAAADPPRIAGQGAHQAIRRAGAFARRAGGRRRGAPQHFRQGDARAAVRRPRPHADRAATRRAGRFQNAADLHSRHRSADAQRELLRARRRYFRPSRQSSRPAAGQARLQWRGRARQFHREARLQRRRGRVGERASDRRAAGRRAQAYARSQLAPRGACARRRPAGLRWPDDAQGRRPVQRQFEHRPARRPASRVGRRAARL